MTSFHFYPNLHPEHTCLAVVSNAANKSLGAERLGAKPCGEEADYQVDIEVDGREIETFLCADHTADLMLAVSTGETVSPVKTVRSDECVN